MRQQVAERFARGFLDKLGMTVLVQRVAGKDPSTTMTNDHSWNDANFETRAIHAGQDPDSATGAVITPIYQTSTYAQEAIGKLKGGYEYSRSDNPTRTALQEALASLESGTWGLAYASGLAATQNIAYLLRPGDHVLLSNDTYGGTFRLFDKVLTNFGIELSLADLSNLDAAKAAIRPHTKIVWVDSTTKYLGGHSDVVGGAVIGNDGDVYETLKFHQNAAGAVPGPFDSWLTLRGIKTLGVRMDRHSANAARVAAWLGEQEAVDTVYYPGLESHPNHEIAARQMKGFSGMVSFTVKGGFKVAAKIVEKTKVFTLAESLGGVESLIEHPGKMTHASVAGTGAEVEDTLIRLSVGIEHVDDQIADLEQAIAAATTRELIGASTHHAD